MPELFSCWCWEVGFRCAAGWHIANNFAIGRFCFLGCGPCGYEVCKLRDMGIHVFISSLKAAAFIVDRLNANMHNDMFLYEIYVWAAERVRGKTLGRR